MGRGGHVEEGAQLIHTALRRKADAGRVEKDLLTERGKFVAGILNVHGLNGWAIVQGGVSPLKRLRFYGGLIGTTEVVP